MGSICSSTTHFAARQRAFDRSAYLLMSGLSHIPAFPHKLVTYLWSSLAVPVAGYGMDVFAYPQSVCFAFQSKERKWWRCFLQVGGRSPNAAVSVVMGLSSSTITWRVQRAALFLKLANAPVGSWKHLAFIAHHHLQSEWFLAAAQDLAIVLTGVRVLPTFVGSSPFLSSSGRWSEFGQWLSYHAYALPTNLDGKCYCPTDCHAAASIRSHVRQIQQLLRTTLTRQYWTTVYDNIAEAAMASESSKLGVLALRLQHPGPPVHICLDAITIPCHRAALASFLCADWFFGKYAKNYFARALLPKTAAHAARAQEANTDVTIVCMSCWHHRREIVLEDEFHVACVCPSYDSARSELLAQLPDNCMLT